MRERMENVNKEAIETLWDSLVESLRELMGDAVERCYPGLQSCLPIGCQYQWHNFTEEWRFLDNWTRVDTIGELVYSNMFQLKYDEELETPVKRLRNAIQEAVKDGTTTPTEYVVRGFVRVLHSYRKRGGTWEINLQRQVLQQWREELSEGNFTALVVQREVARGGKTYTELERTTDSTLDNIVETKCETEQRLRDYFIEVLALDYIHWLQQRRGIDHLHRVRNLIKELIREHAKQTQESRGIEWWEVDSDIIL